MHEVSLCQSIVDLVVQCARREGFTRVTRITLDIGAAAAVEIDALRFCFPMIAETTLARDAEMCIETIPLRARCRSCGGEYAPENLAAPCPACGVYGPEFLAGRELRVRSFDAE